MRKLWCDCKPFDSRVPISCVAITGCRMFYVLVFPGLTALRSDEVIDLMIKEYPPKHAEYSVILQERERQRIDKEYSVSIQKQSNFLGLRITLCFSGAILTFWHVCLLSCPSQQMQQQNPQKVEPSKVPEYIKKAAKKAAEFNSNFNRERMEERRAYFDLQTHVSTFIWLGEVLQRLLLVEQNFGTSFSFSFRLSKFPRADSRCWPLSWPRRCPTQWRSYQDSSKNTTKGPLDTLQ